MSTSSASTTANATATVVDVDTNYVVADNKTTFQVYNGYSSAAADHSWICKEPPPVGPFDSQKTALEVLKQYAVRQGFAISVSRSRTICPKRSFFDMCAVKILWEIPQSADVNARLWNKKGRLFIRARDHV